MKIVSVTNQTKGNTVARDVRVLNSMWSRFLGLMGRKSLPAGQGVLIDPCSSIHTMFMRFPIDVVFLDRERRVVKVAPAVPPFRAVVPRGARCVLELNAGAAAETGVQEGDQLAFSQAQAG